MKTTLLGLAFLFGATLVLADSPDSTFYKNAAEGGMSEVELGQLAQQKGTNPAVKEFGAMMIKDTAKQTKSSRRSRRRSKSNCPKVRV